MRWLRFGLLATGGSVLVLGLALVGAWWWLADPDQAPEAATGRRSVSPTETSGFMVAAAHPLAAAAGQTILQAGGTAIDAAVAVQAMLTLVEPQSSGIGGGAFLLHFDGKSGSFDAFDGREVAPAGASPELFLRETDGRPYDFFSALVGGRSVGVPGVLRMLAEAHRRFGARPWRELFAPAIQAAREGFRVTPRLHRLLRRDPAFRAMPVARALFYTGGEALPVGTVLKNPELADVLTAIAEQGADALYEGPIAKAIVEAVKGAQQPSTTALATNALLLRYGFPFGSGWTASVDAPGLLAEEDLASYKPVVRKPVCIEYRSTYRICGHPPPTSGGVTTLQILGMLERFPLPDLKPRSAEAAHLLTEAGRLAFADRNKYIGDPDFVDVPVEALLDPGYLRDRSALIDLGKAMERVEPGDIEPRARYERWDPDGSPSLPSTSHFSIFDREGSVVSMTTSVENAFGSRLVVRGFVLNNQLTDFAFVPRREGRRVANAVEAKKRPRSSMSPLVVFDLTSGQPVMAVGSPGGSRIIGYVAQTVVAVLDWKLSPQAAVELPHMLGRSGACELEDEGWAPGELEDLRARLLEMGHTVKISSQNSGLHVVRKTPEGTFRGGIDPRREGRALGPAD